MKLRMQKKHYVNNKLLYENLVSYNEKKKERPGQRVEIPRYVIECITLICNRLSRKPCYSSYTYLEDMVAEAIMNCVIGVDLFNVEKYTNGHAWFTTIAYNSFHKVIDNEREQAYVLHKNFQNQYVLGIADATPNDMSDKVVNGYEETLRKRREKQKQKDLEKKNGTKNLC